MIIWTVSEMETRFPANKVFVVTRFCHYIFIESHRFRSCYDAPLCSRLRAC